MSAGVTVLDIVLLSVLAVSLLLGLWRGLTFEVISLAAWAAAFFAAQWFAPWMGGVLPLGEMSDGVRHAAGFAVVFIAALFAGGLVAVLARKMMQAMGLSPMDRMLGAAFGVARAVVLLLAFAVVVNLTPAREAHWWQASTGATVLTASLQGMKPAMPQEFGSYLP